MAISHQLFNQLIILVKQIFSHTDDERVGGRRIEKFESREVRCENYYFTYYVVIL